MFQPNEIVKEPLKEEEVMEWYFFRMNMCWFISTIIKSIFLSDEVLNNF